MVQIHVGLLQVAKSVIEEVVQGCDLLRSDIGAQYGEIVQEFLLPHLYGRRGNSYQSRAISTLAKLVRHSVALITEIFLHTRLRITSSLVQSTWQLVVSIITQIRLFCFDIVSHLIRHQGLTRADVSSSLRTVTLEYWVIHLPKMLITWSSMVLVQALLCKHLPGVWDRDCSFTLCYIV